MLRSRRLYWVIALAIAAVLLYFSLRGIEWRQVGLILARAKTGYIALWLLVGAASVFMRAMRWRILLQSAGSIVNRSTAFWATAAGYFGNNFLPARAGELIRTVMVSAESGLSKTFALTTALSERLCDAVALVLIVSGALLSLPNPPGWFKYASRPFAIAGLCGAVAIAVLPLLEQRWRRLAQRAPLPEKYLAKLFSMLEQALAGARAFHSSRRLAAFIASVCVIWLLDALGVLIGMRALGLHVNLAVAFLLIAGLGLGSALPATPGYVGIYQFVAVSVLVPFGLSKADAIAFILLSQALNYVTTAIWGIIAFARSRVLKLSSAAALAREQPALAHQDTGPGHR